MRDRSASDDGTPLVAVTPVQGALRLAAVNDAAAGLGLDCGLALADARAMYPQIAVADADAQADRRALIAIADWCDRYTPLVGLDRPDGLFLDISGCAHLFGGEAALGRDILARLAGQGFKARAAIADTVGGAWALAHYGDATDASAAPVGGQDLHIVPIGRTRDVLLALPLAALRIASRIVAALAQLGLARIADIIDRPRAPLAARFGEDLVQRLDRALGEADEPISPRRPVPPYVVERRFAEPIALEADVLGTIAQLSQELARLLERRGEGARLIEVALFRTDGKVNRMTAGTGAPLRDPARIRALFVERLAAIGDDYDPGFGYDVVRLGARAAERSDPVQTGFAVPDHAAALAHLVDRLGARFGLRRVTRLIPQNTHIPEFTVTAVAAASHRSPQPAPEKARDCTQPSLDSLAPRRPLRLLEPPERIEAMAAVPDGPPVQFTWRRVRYQVARAEGPERIAMEWWRDTHGRAMTRDYFRVESREGMRVWLYREGAFNTRAMPHWFLHGVFA
ncbi:MAG: DNA polymerase Y family protein [Hyphomicrobiales bacterium]|nr:DNA polymerase Y family protein [Hyphomicrobiales bacterium]